MKKSLFSVMVVDVTAFVALKARMVTLARSARPDVVMAQPLPPPRHVPRPPSLHLRCQCPR